MKQIFTGAFGCGKTKSLINIYLGLIESGKGSPDEILFLSLNENNIKDRAMPILKNVLKNGCGELWVDSYSSFARKILKKHSLEAGVPPNFEVLSGLEERLLLENVIEHGVKLKHFEDVKKYPGFINSVVDTIDLIKLNEQKFKESKIKDDKTLSEKFDDLLLLYNAYQNEIKKKQLVDYKGLALLTLNLWQSHPELLKLYTNKFKYLIVDDIEEITYVDQQLVESLADNIPNLLFAGNINGSVFRFRGAQAEKSLPKLIEKYSLENIKLEKNESAFKYSYKVCESETAEAEYAARQVRGLVKSGQYNFEDIAVLHRDFSGNAAIFRDVFNRYMIPFNFGGSEVFSNPQIILLISILKILYLKKRGRIYDCSDEWFISIWKALHIEEGAGDDAYRLKEYCGNTKENIFVLAQEIVLEKNAEKYKTFLNILSEGFKDKADRFNEFILKYENDIERSAISDVINNLIYELGLWEYALDNPWQIDILRSFYDVVKDFDAIERRFNNTELELERFIYLLDKMLSAYSLETNADNNNQNSIDIITPQKAKGKYYKVIFLTGLAEGIMPRQYRENALLTNHEMSVLNIATIHNIDEFLVQEETMFNVSITRYTEKLFLSYPKSSGLQKDLSASSFLQSKINAGDLCSAEEDIYCKDDIVSSDININDVQTNAELELFKIKNGIIEFKENSIIRAKQSDILNDFAFSASSLKLFNECPAKFMFDKILKIKQPENASLIFGTIVHSILEEFHRMYNESVKTGDLKTKEYAKELIEKHFNLNRAKFVSKGDFDWYKKRAENIMADYAEDLEEYGDWKITALEKSFDVNFEGHKIKGRVDRIDENNSGELRIIDYKTNKSNVPMETALKTAVKKGDDYQPVIYYYAMRELYGDKVKSMIYHWLQKKTGKKLAKLSFDEEEMEDVLRQGLEHLRSILNEINKSKFLSKPKNHYNCGKCYYNLLCETSLLE
ncbi:MAG: ATP-dependent DNA helicase [Elusimicrobiota bacterium]